VKYFEDFIVGEEHIGEATYMVTEEEIREFGERWDPQPFHINPVAAESSIFGGLVASSVHLFAILFAIGNAQEMEPIAAVSALGFDNIRVRAPTRPGHELTLRTTVLECRLSNSRPDMGIVRSLDELVNQHGEIVYTAEPAALIKRRPLTEGLNEAEVASVSSAPPP
jgi:acyl dehydratase